MVTILVNEKESEGVMWIYESAAEAPTQHSFDEVDGAGGRVHRVSVTVETEETLWVGVYGSYLEVDGDDYPFDIVAWQAVFD